MNIFLRMLGRLTGRPVREVGMRVSHDGKASLGELSPLARLSHRLMGLGFKIGPPGKPLSYLTTNDLDPKTKKPYPDYLERRKREGAARIIFDDLVLDEGEKKTDDGKEGQAAVIFSAHDVYPD
jgi:hypothetical protein